MDLPITAAIARIKADDAHYLTPEAIKIVCQVGYMTGKDVHDRIADGMIGALNFVGLW